MSEENIETAKRLYPGELDVAGLLADPDVARAALEPFLHPEFEMVRTVREILTAGEVRDESLRPTTRGVDGFIAAWTDWLSAWETWLAKPSEFIDVDGERVLVLLDVRARSKTHQVEIPLDGANLLTFRDGKLARLEIYLTRDEALEAAGLRE